MAGLRLRLTIYDSEPKLPYQSTGGDSLLTAQLWVGGVTDRKTRTMTAAPRRWLLVVEARGALPFVPADGAELFEWDLEQIYPGGQQSPENAGGVIISAMDIDPQAEEEFNDWYNTEHMPVLSNLPGVLAARRFRAHQGKPSYIALYHVSDLSIYAEPSWSAVNETAWTERMRRYQHNRTYFMFSRTVNRTQEPRLAGASGLSR
jgi:hypothetical protein